MRYPILTFLVSTYVITWSAWGVLLALFGRTPIEELVASPLAIAIVYIGALGPTIAALGLTWVEGGLPAVREFLKSRFLVKAGFIAKLVAFLIPVGSAVIATAIAVYFSVELGEPDLLGFLHIAWLGAVIVFFAGPVCEEIGWRGYLQPRLLEVTNPLIAVLVIGTAWCFWHLPLSLTPGTTPVLDTAFAWLLYYADTIATSAVMMGVVLWAKGNVGVAMLYHWSSNVAFSHFIAPLLPHASEAGWDVARGVHLGIIVVCGVIALWLVYRMWRLATLPPGTHPSAG